MSRRWWYLAGLGNQKQMLFDVEGPFELERYGPKKLLTKESLKDLILQMEDRCIGLSKACGCYVFALRAGKGFTPHYVGRASKRTLPREALNASNLGKYNEVMGDKNGTPLLFVIPLKTPKEKYKKTANVKPHSAVLFLERWLIAHAIEKNPNLVNNKETKFLRNIRVKGILNSGQGQSTLASRELWATLWG